MSKTKVLFLIHTLQVGGAERVLVDLVNNLPEDKYDITVMTVVDLGALKGQLKSHIHYKSIFSFSFLRKISGGSDKYEESTNTSTQKNIAKELFIKSYISFWKHANLKKLYIKHIKEKYDVEVSFLEGIPAKIIANSTNSDSKKICWIHIDLINENKSDRFFKNLDEQKQTYDKFDNIVCVSGVVKERFIKKYNLDKNKVSVLYNPIDSAKIVDKSKELTDLKKEKFTFCTVGRLAKQKGYDRLINVCSKLEKEGYDFDTWIVGVGSEEGVLKNLVESKGTKCVKFLGYKKNPYPYIKAADWFVCSSRAEGFSTVVAESIVLGKAIISTDCSGAKEMLGDKSEYGIVCDNNEDDLYFTMKKVLDNRTIGGKYAEQIKSRKKLFILDDSIGKIEEMLEVKNAEK